MPASPLPRRRRLVLVVAVVILLVVASAVAVTVALRSGADPAAGASPSASSASPGGASNGSAEGDAADGQGGAAGAADDEQPVADAEDGTAGADAAGAPEPRETLDPAPFDAEVTPEPGVTVTVPSVEKVTGEANVPGEVGGPALRFTVELTNGTGEALDLRTVVVNAYYGPDRTPATPLLQPGGRAFAPEVAADSSADGEFVFAVPADLQDRVELEVDPGVGAAIVIFAGA